MLSPHEFSTLMLVKAAPEQVNLPRNELGILLERQLVGLDKPPSGAERPRLSPHGNALLVAVAQKALIDCGPKRPRVKSVKLLCDRT